MLSCERALEQLNDFIDGTLGAARATEVTTHLDRCRPCRREYRALRETLSMLRSEPVPESDDARDRTLARFRHNVGARPASATRRGPWMAAPLSLAAAAALAALVLNFNPVRPSIAPFARAIEAPAPDTLPSHDELAQMNRLHDLQSYAVSRDDAQDAPAAAGY